MSLGNHVPWWSEKLLIAFRITFISQIWLSKPWMIQLLVVGGCGVVGAVFESKARQVWGPCKQQNDEMNIGELNTDAVCISPKLSPMFNEAFFMPCKMASMRMQEPLVCRQKSRQAIRQ